MGAVETVLDVVTDNRTYYDCPKCGREVWAYGSYVGNVCWQCPNTIGHAVINTTDLATAGLTSTIIDAACDNKTEYRCPRCGVKKWAYGVGIGRPCLQCIGKNVFDINCPAFGDKSWFNMSDASELEVSLNSLLTNNNYYNENGNEITILGNKFTNVINKNKLKKAREYKQISTDWCCGNNAINICLKIHGYDDSKQLSGKDYKYNSFLKCGWSYENFYILNIQNNFTYCGWTGTETCARDVSVKWDYINDTDYKNYSLIIMGGRGTCAHYTIIIGVSNDNKYYLVTDQSLKIWLVDVSLVRKISVYEATRGMGVNLYKQHSCYRVG